MLDLIMKCSGECASAGDHPRVAAFGFTVRRDHRVVYKASGIIDAVLCGERARQESVRQALAWLLAQPVSVGTVQIRCDSHHATWELELADLRRAGWAVEFQVVCPELVSEAAALSRQAAIETLRARGLGALAHWETRVCETAAAAAPSTSPGPRPPDTTGSTSPDAIIICDGGYKPHPYSLATYACLVWAGVQLAHRESGVVCWGRAAGSHVAELAATVAALRWLAASPLAEGTRVQLRSDNQWVVNALTGRLRRRPLPGTVMLLRTVERLLTRLSRVGCEVAIRQVPRKQVAQADALCRKVYRDRLARSGARKLRQPLKAFLRPASTEWQSRV